MKTVNKITPGRPRSEQSKTAIIDATANLMSRLPIRNITIEAIAREAGVGKPTIYRWWESKCDLVLETFLIKSSPELPLPEEQSLPDLIAEHLAVMKDFLRGDCGRIISQLIGEGQNDKQLLEKFKLNFYKVLLDPIETLLKKALDESKSRINLNATAVIDCLYGPLFFQLLMHSNEAGTDLLVLLQQNARALLKDI